MSSCRKNVSVLKLSRMHNICRVLFYIFQAKRAQDVDKMRIILDCYSPLWIRSANALTLFLCTADTGSVAQGMARTYTA